MHVVKIHINTHVAEQAMRVVVEVLVQANIQVVFVLLNIHGTMEFANIAEIVINTHVVELVMRVE